MNSRGKVPPHPGGEPSTRERKTVLRAHLRNLRDTIPEHLREEKSAIIGQKALTLVRSLQAKTVHLFFSFGSEPDTHSLASALLDEGLVLVVPVVQKTGLVLTRFKSGSPVRPGPFGIREPFLVHPVPPEDVDLFLLPGLGFDRNGGRIGYGKGYYDRLLRKTAAPRIALAFQEQIVDRVPLSETDILVNTIITDKEIIRCDRSRQD